MKYISLIFQGVLATFAVAAPASKSDGTLLLPITRKLSNGSTSATAKRDVNLPFENEILRYVATFDVGTPGQEVELKLDTGSADMWVYGPNFGATGTYDPSKSSSYKFLNDDFNAPYYIGSASGSWAIDDVTILGNTVKNQQFGIANASVHQQHGFLGLAKQERESSHVKYDTFTMNLVKQGITNSNTYSMYLDDVNALTGAVLFGGIDHAKYTGDLFEIPFLDEIKFLLNVTIRGYGGEFLTLLDSGTSLTFVPEEILEAIANDLGARHNSESGYYEFDQLPEEKDLIFDFGAGQIKVSSSALIWEGKNLGDSAGAKYILAMVAQAENKSYGYLGDSFLRSAYVFYNLDNMTASLAQSSYSGNSNISQW